MLHHPFAGDFSLSATRQQSCLEESVFWKYSKKELALYAHMLEMNDGLLVCGSSSGPVLRCWWTFSSKQDEKAPWSGDKPSASARLWPIACDRWFSPKKAPFAQKINNIYIFFFTLSTDVTNRKVGNFSRESERHETDLEVILLWPTRFFVSFYSLMIFPETLSQNIFDSFWKKNERCQHYSDFLIWDIRVELRTDGQFLEGLFYMLFLWWI